MHIQTTHVRSGDVNLAVHSWAADAGADDDRPTVLLVHGYPDSSHVWHQVAPLLAQHYRVVAYDVRGAGASDKPRAIRAYRLAQLAQDFEAVMDAVSPDAPVHVLAHDWGSIQSWEPVTDPRLASRIASFTSVSGPCLDHAALWLRQRLKSGQRTAIKQALDQLQHSWYIGMFQLPLLAPLLWHLGLDQLWPGIIQRSERLPHKYINPTQKPDGRHGVQLYRANFGLRPARPRQRHTRVPVQLIIPLHDNFVRAQLFDDLLQWAPNLWRREVEAGHWLPISHPQLLASQVHEFVQHIETGAVSTELAQARMG